MKQRHAWWMAAVLTAVGAGLGAGARVASPTFVAVGGALKDDNDAIFKALLARTDMGKIVIVPYASADAEAAGKSSTERFTKLRPDVKCLVLPDAAKGEAEKKLAAEWIAHADLVWFTGGDQSRLISRFYDGDRPNVVLEALREGMLKWDTRVGGTSAGCACLSDPMFTGGGSEAALGGAAKSDEDDAEGKEKAPSGSLREPPPPSKAAGEVKKAGPQIGRGLGLIPGVIMDSHFAQRGRYGRLVAALEKSGTRFGVGVNENRAVEVSGGLFRGIGDAAAIAVDTGSMTREGLSRLNVRLTLLGDGETVRLPADRTGPPEFTSPREHTPSVPAGKAMADSLGAPTDAWGKNALVAMLLRVAADPTVPQHALSDRFDVTVSADKSTRFTSDGGARVGVQNARLDIRDRHAAAGTAPPAAPAPSAPGTAPAKK